MMRWVPVYEFVGYQRDRCPKHVVANIRVNNFAISAMAPGAFMVDLFPIR